MQIAVAIAQPEDSVALAALDSQINPSPWSAERFRAVCAAGAASTTLIARGADGIQGFLVYSRVLDEATLLSIGVRREVQRQGLGGRLLDTACLRMCSEGAQRCLLEVRVSNRAAIRMYESRAFQPDGVRKAYYRGEQGHEDALLMSRLL